MQKDKMLSPEETAELKKNALGILLNIRQRMICDHPFIGNVAMKLNVMPIRDLRCRTASTDGRNIYFDIEFLSNLTDDEKMFVFCHEVWHNVLLHFVRRQTREPELFNIATDLEVNQLLVKDGLKNFPSDLCWPSKFDVPSDKSAETYYELLLKKNKNNKQNNLMSGNGEGGIPGSGNHNSSGNSSKNGKQSSNKGLSGQFDKHEYDNSSELSEEEKKKLLDEMCHDKYGQLGFDDDYNPCVTEDSAEKMREAAIAAAQMAERSRGTLPGHIAEIVNKLKKPEIRWQELLAQFVTRCIGEKRQWCPPNRRHVWNDTYLQSRRGEKIKIAVGIDTSGSTQGDISKFLGELNALVKSFGNYEIHLIQCDAKVQDYKMYSPEIPLDLENEKFELAGCGGTELHPIFDYVKDNDLDIDAYVIFTDGYIETFSKSDDPGKPTLWILTKDGCSDSIKFGEIVKFKENSWDD